MHKAFLLPGMFSVLQICTVSVSDNEAEHKDREHILRGNRNPIIDRPDYVRPILGVTATPISTTRIEARYFPTHTIQTTTEGIRSGALTLACTDLSHAIPGALIDQRYIINSKN